jgi:hypothetical protein
MKTAKNKRFCQKTRITYGISDTQRVGYIMRMQSIWKKEWIEMCVKRTAAVRHWFFQIYEKEC